MGATRIVSIHAPARGATEISADHAGMLRGFNPRSREGSDGVCVHGSLGGFEFQSTLPRGERQQAGRDGQGVPQVSIHAPARGATDDPVMTECQILPFQSTLPRGERQG